ncbi:hypothetical protein CEUSTIGMA_g6111.t1 [Chlamydomonas eustigma]|uniref:Pantoate--beta-alanine ligase n=1 Tax=Chlamydomonas eustigma TaxID=1157962 RepID=A0A250X6G5_9CHLO|nr:hypothetical protein CEUSTIGMA_g6111.t1 [Chlamydomonas eustigma]|eukprot:GAX78673.1 hypothetical protein CEUSTIGMA_g6111.t1 [Chlamydomonas eustigma]
MSVQNEMHIFSSASEMRNWSRQQKQKGKRIALVPTMGYLHEGHLSLVEAAKELADIVVSSIYVNPTQFAAHEDFGQYPRQPEVDRAKLKAMGCSAVFEPTSLYVKVQGAESEDVNVVGKESMHPESHETFVQVERLQKPLCGGSRPHFFRGVATVVTKLFHIVEPDVAVFGRKDYQQWRIIERMVRDLDFGVEVVGMPICREQDGLAMSSRNARLTAEARQHAPAIYKALRWAMQAVESGAEKNPGTIQDQVRGMIEQAGGKMDYAELVDAKSLQPILDASLQTTLLAVAALFPSKDSQGTVRLIDNIVINEEILL